jgi:integrase
VPRLTKRTIDALRPDPLGRDHFVWDAGDGAVKGFGVRVKPSGIASYLVQYRNRHGRTRRLALGRVGVLTPDEARKLAVDRLHEVAKGRDPSAERRVERNAITIADLCAEYLDKAERGLIITRRREPKRASTLLVDRGRIARHIIPLLGQRTVRDLTQRDVRAFMRDVIEGRTKADVKTRKHGRAWVRGGRGTATRTMGLFGAIFSYAVEEGYCEHNPVRGIVGPADQRRDVRLDPGQYRALGEALDAAEFDEHWQAVAAIRLLALTGSRSGEVFNLRWSQVDEPGRCLRLEASKTGRSLRPLSPLANAILKGVRKRSGAGEYVFPAVRDQGIVFGDFPRAWQRIAKRANLAGIPAYGLRHAFISVANELGYSEATIGAIVGNGGNSVTAGYIHHADSVLLAAANRIAQHIDAMMKGEQASVIAFPPVAQVEHRAAAT